MAEHSTSCNRATTDGRENITVCCILGIYGGARAVRKNKFRGSYLCRVPAWLRAFACINSNMHGSTCSDTSWLTGFVLAAFAFFAFYAWEEHGVFLCAFCAWAFGQTWFGRHVHGEGMKHN